MIRSEPAGDGAFNFSLALGRRRRAVLAVEQVERGRRDVHADGVAGLQLGALVLARDELHRALVRGLGADVGVDQRVGAERLDQLDPAGEPASPGRPHEHALGPHADEAVGRHR